MINAIGRFNAAATAFNACDVPPSQGDPYSSSIYDANRDEVFIIIWLYSRAAIVIGCRVNAFNALHSFVAAWHFYCLKSASFRGDT